MVCRRLSASAFLDARMQTTRTMSLWSLILWFVFTAAVVMNYYTYVMKDEYIVTKTIPCLAGTGSCFVSQCLSDDSSCTAAPYKKIRVESRYAGSEFERLTCTSGDLHCSIVSCNSSTLESGENCI